MARYRIDYGYGNGWNAGMDRDRGYDADHGRHEGGFPGGMNRQGRPGGGESGCSFFRSFAMPAWSLLSRQNSPVGSTHTSSMSFETSIPTKYEVATGPIPLRLMKHKFGRVAEFYAGDASGGLLLSLLHERLAKPECMMEVQRSEERKEHHLPEQRHGGRPPHKSPVHRFAFPSRGSLPCSAAQKEE